MQLNAFMRGTKLANNGSLIANASYPDQSQRHSQCTQNRDRVLFEQLGHFCAGSLSAAWRTELERAHLESPSLST